MGMECYISQADGPGRWLLGSAIPLFSGDVARLFISGKQAVEGLL